MARKPRTNGDGPLALGHDPAVTSPEVAFEPTVHPPEPGGGGDHEALSRIAEAERTVGLKQNRYEAAKVQAKYAKEEFDGAVQVLRDLIKAEAEALPLFDAREAPQEPRHGDDGA